MDKTTSFSTFSSYYIQSTYLKFTRSVTYAAILNEKLDILIIDTRLSIYIVNFKNYVLKVFLFNLEYTEFQLGNS